MNEKKKKWNLHTISMAVTSLLLALCIIAAQAEGDPPMGGVMEVPAAAGEIAAEDAALRVSGMAAAVRGFSVMEYAVEVGGKQTLDKVEGLSPEERFRISNYGDTRPETSLGALALIGMCNYYNDTMRSDSDPWYNSNTTRVSRVGTFDQMTRAKKKGCNCNGLANWALIDLGIIPPGTGIYGTESKKVHNYNDGSTRLKKKLDAACEVISVHGAKLKSLARSGKVKPGDILCTKLHTYIYRDDSTLFVSAGDAKHTRNHVGMVFLNWVRKTRDTYNWNRPVYYIVRIKEDYVPQYYRNRTGALVETPMALEESEDPEAGEIYKTDETT